MQTILKNPRNGCAFQGALQTVLAIKGAVPIVHSTSGCAYQNYLANKAGGFGDNSLSTLEAPGTNMQERHIIFGGASRLREQIKNTVKVVDGKIYVVLNSCPSAMVGDDVDAMVREANEQGEKVIDGLSAGFHGDVHFGYSQILTEIFGNLPKIFQETEAADSTSTNFSGEYKATVNLLGIIPNKDLTYKGDLEEIKNILGRFGVKANTFFGNTDGVQELLDAKKADLTISFSKWGTNPAEKLKQLYEIQVLSFTSVPLGLDETTTFLKAVFDQLKLDFALAEKYLQEEAEKTDFYFSSLRELFYQKHLNKPVDIVADEANAVRFSNFLKNHFGTEINSAIITDFVPTEDYPESKKAEELASLANEIHFSQDTSEINSLLSYTNTKIILGSSLEKKSSEKKKGKLFAASYPDNDHVYLSKTYAGITGSINFTEDFASL